MAKDYTSIAIKQQVMLERLKSGQVSQYAKEMKKLERLVRVSIAEAGEDVAGLSVRELNKLIAGLNAGQAEIYAAANAQLAKDSSKIADLYAVQETTALQQTVDLRGTKLDKFTKAQTFSRALKQPLSTNGELLEPWIRDFSDKEIKRVSNTIRMGHSQGQTNRAMVSQVIGTQANSYKDGILETSRRNASTVVRTSVQHVASVARNDVWEKNKDIVRGYEWLSTLDSITSKQCQSLDGQKFDLGKGPIPPIHPNCRSTTTPVLDSKYDFLDAGATRSASGGPVDADTTYFGWLGDQDEKTQIEVLGPKRAKLFRDGGLSAEKFRALQFDKNFAPLTLAQMEKMEPEAFRKAGLIGAPTPKVATPKVSPSTQLAVAKKVANTAALDPRPKVFSTLEKAGHTFGDTSYTKYVKNEPRIVLSKKGSHFQNSTNTIQLNSIGTRYTPQNKTMQKVVAHEYGHAMHHQNKWISHGTEPSPIVLKAYAKGEAEVKKQSVKFSKLLGSEKGKLGSTNHAYNARKNFFELIKNNPKFKNFTDAEIYEGIGGMADTVGAITNNRIGWGHKDKYYRDRNRSSGGRKFGHLAEFFAHSVENRHGYNQIFKEYAPELFDITTGMMDELYNTVK